RRMIAETSCGETVRSPAPSAAGIATRAVACGPSTTWNDRYGTSPSASLSDRPISLFTLATVESGNSTARSFASYPIATGLNAPPRPALHPDPPPPRTPPGSSGRPSPPATTRATAPPAPPAGHDATATSELVVPRSIPTIGAGTRDEDAPDRVIHKDGRVAARS